MRRDIADWIVKDADRRRTFDTDPVYHAQAQWLSTALDAMQDAMEVVLGGDPAVEQAMHAAIHAVLGSIEASEERARAMREAVTKVELTADPDWIRRLGPPLHQRPVGEDPWRS